MKITLELDDKEYWVEWSKPTFSRKDMRVWREKLETLDVDTVMGQLAEWCDGCHVEDVDGDEYENLEDIDEEVWESMDYAVTDFLANIPMHVRDERSRLGKVSSER